MALFTLGTFLASIAPAFGVLLAKTYDPSRRLSNHDAFINECDANCISS